MVHASPLVPTVGINTYFRGLAATVGVGSGHDDVLDRQFWKGEALLVAIEYRNSLP
jgi:hypothetical protein